jgi:membrane protein required for colicin V production
MTLFDIAAGLVLLVSALVGWIRGGTREIATVLAFVFAAVIALFALRIHQTAGLSGADRLLGAGFGLLRALVILGLANLTINAITPPERMPVWISHAYLYPLSDLSARTLKAFAPQGAKLARQVGPVVGHAITEDSDTNNAGNQP